MTNGPRIKCSFRIVFDSRIFQMIYKGINWIEVARPTKWKKTIRKTQFRLANIDKSMFWVETIYWNKTTKTFCIIYQKRVFPLALMLECKNISNFWVHLDKFNRTVYQKKENNFILFGLYHEAGARSRNEFWFHDKQLIKIDIVACITKCGYQHPAQASFSK